MHCIVLSSSYTDFKHMQGLGRLMSKAGAFYMRRKFADDKLYWNVFKEFIRSLVTNSDTGFEFFIEGTRSRTMKALPPKIGLLSMALESFFMGQVVDITIVPVSISYERPLEEQLFAYELLGVPKPKESTWVSTVIQVTFLCLSPIINFLPLYKGPHQIHLCTGQPVLRQHVRPLP